MKVTLLFSFVLSSLLAPATGQPAWFARISRDFDDSAFPLRACGKRMNEAPASGSMCGPKSKTCFFGDAVCGSGDSSFPHPQERCLCDGVDDESENVFGTWTCQPVDCPGGQEAQEEVEDSATPVTEAPATATGAPVSEVPVSLTTTAPVLVSPIATVAPSTVAPVSVATEAPGSEAPASSTTVAPLTPNPLMTTKDSVAPATSAPDTTTDAPATGAQVVLTTVAPTTPSPVVTAEDTAALATTLPATAAPTTPNPVATTEGTAAPVTALPATAAPTTPNPVATTEDTTAPATTLPAVATPSTSSPVVATMEDSVAPATVLPATMAPTTSSPVEDTVAPATVVPATTAPTTPSPVEDPSTPATDVPATAAPSTPSPVEDTVSPETGVPTTAAPTTSSPVEDTVAPVTAVPATTAPNTPSPVEDTVSPATVVPVTAAPTTPSPVDDTITTATNVPATPAPNTPSPVEDTASPATVVPATAAPVTSSPAVQVVPTQPPQLPPAEPYVCVDATLSEVPWFDRDGDPCRVYQMNRFCERFGDGFATLGVTANMACCLCGGGEVDSATGVCTDTPLTFDPPIRWFDSVGQGCDWYAASPQSRCIDFANERNAVLGLTLGEACCACKDVEPPDDPTCKDLSGWTTAGGNTCSSLTREDCLRSTENFGITARTACCKCGGGLAPDSEQVFEPPTEPFTAGSCTSDNTRFNMCIKISTNVGPQDVASFGNAARRWSEVIVADSPDFSYGQDELLFASRGSPRTAAALPRFYRNLCEFDPGFPTDTTDDVNVCVSQKVLSPGVLAQAGSVYGDKFTRFGVMDVNAEAVGGLRRRGGSQLEDVLIHELGHILGIGTLWESDAPGQFSVDQQCEYTGEVANELYRDISGCEASIPLEEPREVSFGGRTFLNCGGHLQETCFRDELMTPIAARGFGPLSTLSVALLEDLGYTVDYDAADPFTTRDMDRSCLCGNRRELQDQEDEAHSPPKRQLSTKGRAEVVAHAKQELKRMNDAAAEMAYELEDGEGEDEAIAVSIPGLMVMYMEDDAVHTVYVMNGDWEEVD